MKLFSIIILIFFAFVWVVAASPYFPQGSISDFEQEWYGKHLAAMKEPVLSPVGKGTDYFAFRVIYLPTWGPPIAVRYAGEDEAFIRRSVKLSGHGGYAPGKIAFEKQENVPKSEVAELIMALDKAGFWKMPQKDEVVGLDGSKLIVETIKDGEHRVRVRWTPEYDAVKRNLSGIVAIYKSQFQNAGIWEKDGG